jgi:hypothetical protein
MAARATGLIHWAATGCGIRSASRLRDSSRGVKPSKGLDPPIDLRRERVDLRDVVRRAAEDFRSMMEDRGIAFRTTVPGTKVWADADQTRITQVVGNLLHNAAKFTRRGDEVTLSLAAIGPEAEIRVRDTGAGVDAALLGRLFEPFVQGERTLARSEGGLGLGLALAKGIIELHWGTVRAESGGTGMGSEFIVRLPLAVAAAAQDSPQPAVARSAPRRRVLVVDENVDAAESVADIIKWRATWSRSPSTGRAPSRRRGSTGRTSCCATSGSPG